MESLVREWDSEGYVSREYQIVQADCEDITVSGDFKYIGEEALKCARVSQKPLAHCSSGRWVVPEYVSEVPLACLAQLWPEK